MTTLEKFSGFIKSEQGLVLPLWLQGSRVTYSVASENWDFIFFMTDVSACGPPKIHDNQRIRFYHY